MGQVIPGTLNTTVFRLAPIAVDEPDSGAGAGLEPESEQPTTSNKANKRPKERFILIFLSISEKNGGGSVTNTRDSNRFCMHVDRLNSDERDTR